MAAPTNAELLEAARNALKGQLDRNAARYRILGRELQSYSPQELLGVIATLEQWVANDNVETSADGLPWGHGVGEPMT